MQADFATSVVLSSAVRVPRAEPGRPLVVALHGWGMNERSFDRWLRPALERDGISWWIPRGVLPCEVRQRRIGYGWYVFDGDQAALRTSMDEARAYLVGLVEMARRVLRPPSVTLLGFSQGAYLGSYVALSRPDLFAAFVCCCGRPKTEFIDDLAAARGVRVLVQTGRDDAGLPPEVVARGVGPLRAAGVPVEERSYPGGHKLSPEMAAAAADFVLGGSGGVRIRAHNLLCIQGFVGKGYSPEFVANMSRVVQSLDAAAEVTVVDRPDVLCDACPNLTDTGCALHGAGTERGIVAQDRDVMQRLGIQAGETLPWGEVLRRIRSAVAPDDLDAICGTCPWLPLGHCKAGLRRLGCDTRVAPPGS